MAKAPASIVSEYLRRVAAEQPTDAELLARFAARNDGEAFALLVRRHGPMVLGVCRRGAMESADDVFQATFLALARQAGRVRESLPGWLHCVATRIARRTVRRPSEPLGDAADRADPFAEVEWRDLRAALDAELAALPNRLRTPLILCYLDGMTRDEAAVQLGCSLRTLHRRLEEGRRRLRDRLSRRGLAPVLLGAAGLSLDGLRAAVSPALCQAVVDQATRVTSVSAAVKDLLPVASGMRGTVMKLLVALAIVAGGITAAIAFRQRATAETIPAAVSGNPVRAPLPRDPPEAEELAAKVGRTRTAAVAWLVKQQNADGSWGKDDRNTPVRGGETALAVVALLESGVKPDDVTVKQGLKYLRGLKPQDTYVVSLQTQAFCRANQKEDAEAIRANVRWLEETAARDKGQLIGWSYGTPRGAVAADNSNSRYAVSGLYAAHKSGFKVQRAALWEELRAMYLRMQLPGGGWSYTDRDPNARQTMTCSALLCLAQIEDVIGKKHDDVAAAMKKGFAWLDANFAVTNASFQFYSIDVLAHMGVAARRPKFGEGEKARDWRREAGAWLVKNQHADGRFQGAPGIDANPVLSTAFALRFLAAHDPGGRGSGPP